MERCTWCNRADGQGVPVWDKKPGPLWGPNSWNGGMGASRVHTLAGFVVRLERQYYRVERLPVDAVHYQRP